MANPLPKPEECRPLTTILAEQLHKTHINDPRLQTLNRVFHHLSPEDQFRVRFEMIALGDHRV